MSSAPQKTRTGATLAIVSLALFMVVLDNLVVTVALPAIRADLGATLQSLEWTINAYTLAFAVMLIPGAALGDRFGRRRLFLIGLSLFTASSAAAALAPTTGALVAARALQGIGGAIVAPLTLTLLANAFPADRRGAALGIWSGISGTGVALGPIVGGAVVDGISWHWIFWINVPIGLALLPFAAPRAAREPRPVAHARPAGLRPGLGRPLRARLRPRPRAGRGLDEPAHRRLAGGRRRPPGRLRGLGAAGQGPDGPDGPLPQAHLRGHQRGVVLHVLRDLRLDLPAHPGAAVRPGLHPVPGRRAHAAVDRGDDDRRADRRRPLRALRLARLHGLAGWRCRPARWRGSPPPPARR